MKSPQHVGIIMDGNGRWAKERNLPRKEGHKVGARNCMDIIHQAINKDVKVLSLYAFSTENWSRPSDEVHGIFGLLDLYLQTEILAFLKRGVKFCVLGDKRKLSATTRFWIYNAEKLSRNNTGMVLQLAVNYGGQADIVRAVQKMAKSDIDMTQVQESQLAEHLDGNSDYPVDLVIRTSGERRLSNFMIWQCAYAEFYFSDKLWPDFDSESFDKALQSFASRERRFGQADTTEPDTTEHLNAAGIEQ